VVRRSFTGENGVTPGSGFKRAALLISVVAVLLLPALSFASGSRPTHHPKSPGPFAAPGSPGGKRIAKEAKRTLQAIKRRQAKRRTPAARAQRRRSRRAFRHETRRGALAVARKYQPMLVNTPAWDPIRLHKNERVTRYFGDYDAQIAEGDHGHHRVLDSVLPIRSKVGDGHKRPVDLGLADHGDTLGPANPLVDTEIGKHLRQGITLGGSVGLRLLGGTDSSVTTTGDTALFPEALKDTDLTVLPTPRGAQLALQVRSADAPEVATFHVSMPSGAHLHRVPAPARGKVPKGEPGSVEVLQGRKQIAVIQAPVGWDADHQTVATKYEVAGDKLRLVYLHHSADVRYPLAIDPVFERYRINSSGSLDPNGPNWIIGRTSPFDYAAWNYTYGGYGSENYGNAPAQASNTYEYSGSLALGSTGYRGYGWQSFGQWYWVAPRASWITRADYVNVTLAQYKDPPSLPNDAYPQCLVLGIFSQTQNNWEPGTMTTPSPYPPGYTTTNGPPWIDCTPYSGGQALTDNSSAPTPGNIAAYRLASFDPGYGLANGWSTQMDGAQVVVDDGQAPTVSSQSTTRTSGSATDAGWTEGAGLHTSLSTQDLAPGGTPGTGGIGMYVNALFVPRDGGGNQQLTSFANCDARLTRCPESSPFSYDYTTDGDLDTTTTGTQRMAEGVDTITGTAYDATLKPTNYTAGTVKVDRTAPDIQLSGSLKQAEGTEVAPGHYQLVAALRDGNASGPDSARRSGVRSIEISIDNDPKLTDDQDCATDSCPMDKTLDVDTADLGGGSHTVKVTADDQMGHTSTQSFKFSTSDCCLAPSSSWGNAILHDHILTGDVNGDGLDDVVARTATHNFEVALGTGSGFSSFSTWSTSSDLGSADDVALGDVDGDGLSDLVGRNASTGQVFVGKSSGSDFTAPSAPSGTWPSSSSFLVADADGDGQADLLGRDSATGQVFVGYSTDGTFDSGVSATSYAVPAGADLRAVDVDGDGAADLLIRDGSTLRVGLSDEDGDGGFDALSDWGTFPSSAQLVTGDFDSNGDTDAASVDGSGNVSLMRSNGSAFEAAKPLGSFPAGYTMSSVQGDTDAQADLFGYQPLTGDLRVALTPEMAGLYSDAQDPDPGADDSEDIDDSDGSNTQATDSSAAASLRLGMQDSRRLVDHLGLPETTNSDPNSYIGEPEALGKPGAPGGDRRTDADHDTGVILDRVKQSGSSILRIIVDWGQTENRAGSSSPYYWDAIDRTVDQAKARGLTVYMTITGRAKDECTAYNPDGIGCSAPTGIAPDPAHFQAFATAVVHHFKDRVKSYGIWNEPNNRNFLRNQTDTLLTAHLYRRLYDAAYAGINGEEPTANVMIGELAYTPQSGYTACPCTGKRTHWTAGSYLAATVEPQDGHTGTVRTNGVAWHPYQLADPPGDSGPKGQVGIGKAAAIASKVKGLAAANQLRTPADHTPGVIYTEFGYANTRINPYSRPLSKTGWHTESTRASWFPDALQAAVKNHVKWVILYHATEYTPTESSVLEHHTTPDDDYGLFSSRGDVTGMRPYGRGGHSKAFGGEDPRSENPPFNHPQARAAYCSIRKWAKSHHLPVPTDAANASPCD
jgi:hypothetical protein